MTGEYSTLQDLITCLEYGTKLHIGVLFLGNYGNRYLSVPFEHTIHSGEVCQEMKCKPQGFRRCYRCRNTAISKAIREQRAFGGVCINGVYEYIHPVILERKTVCIIFIGNMLPKEDLRKKIAFDPRLFSTMEPDVSTEQCEQISRLIEQYIRMVMELYPSASEEEYDPLIANIKGYLEENLEYPPDLSRLARMFHYNEKYLGRLFKKKTGTSFCEYINRRRIDRSKQLLRNSDDTVLSVSEQVGFNNVTYFNRMFQRYVGLTPKQYREKRK